VTDAFVPHGVVIEEARHVADDLGLPYWCLNEQASICISGKDDPASAGCSIIPGCACPQQCQPISSR